MRLSWCFRSEEQIKESLSNRLGLAQKGHPLKIRWILVNLEQIRGGGDLEAVG